ncbi:MAG TPA: ABC transporter ATP-binding protein [Myxococcaceae bacterium]|nr:ABC transporter ATP-binding protein [Myxococcaceae bacterium]
MNPAAFELVDVSKVFGAKRAVEQLSLRVPEGSCYGLIGPNGAGKTTTFSMLCGFLRPTAGEVRILGRPVDAPGALKGRVGVLPQDAVLPAGWKVGPLLTYWARLSGVEAPEAAAREALEKVALADVWGSGSQTLSHGMTKRVALAQALLGNPPLVLLDEPTAGLDPKVAALVRQLVESMRGKQTVLISSHNLEELERLCDGAAILDHGRLVQAGSMSELTGAAVGFQVELVPGSDIPLAEILAVPGVQEAVVDPNWQLRVRHTPVEPTVEVVVAGVVRVLLDAGVGFRSISRGQRLEARVLEVT